MSVLEELKRLVEARETGAISDATYKKLRQQITDLVEDADVVTAAPKPTPQKRKPTPQEPTPKPDPKPRPDPKPSPARPRAASKQASARYRAATAKDGEVVKEDKGAHPLEQPSEDPTPRNLWRDAALAGLVVVSGILTAGWLLGDVILALTIVLALLALALIPIAKRLVEEDQDDDPLPPEDEPLET